MNIMEKGEECRLLILLIRIIIRIMGAFLKVRLKVRLRDSYEQHDGLRFEKDVLRVVKMALFSFCYHFLDEGVLINVYS